MESLPVAPIISMVKALWSQECQYPLHIFSTHDNGLVSELSVGLPRAAFVGEKPEQLQVWIPTYVFPLFRLYSQSLTISIYDDKSKLIPLFGYSSKEYLNADAIMNMILAFAFAAPLPGRRVPRRVARSRRPAATRTRHYLNSKKLVLSWEGAFDNPYLVRRLPPVLEPLIYGLDDLGRALLRLPVLKLDFTQEAKNAMGSVEFKSKRRFRR
jgi:hypothetical protein